MKKKYKQCFKALVVLLVVAGMLLMPLSAFAEAPAMGGDEESSQTSSDHGAGAGGSSAAEGAAGSGAGANSGAGSSSSQGASGSASEAGDAGGSTGADSSNQGSEVEPAAVEPAPAASGSEEGQDGASEGSAEPLPGAEGEELGGGEGGAGEFGDEDGGLDEEGGDCYTVTITEVKKTADGKFEVVETPGLTIGTETEKSFEFKFEEVGNSNIARITITIPPGFFWSGERVNFVVVANYGEGKEDPCNREGQANSWSENGFKYTKKDEVNGGGELTFYGDAIFKGGWVSAYLLGVTTPEEAGIYTFKTEVESMEVFSNGDPIYDFTGMNEDGTAKDPEKRYKSNNLAAGHDQPTLWVAGKEVKVGSSGNLQSIINGNDVNDYDVITLTGDRIEDQIEIGKSIYLRGEKSQPITVTLLGEIDGGYGVIVSGAGIDVFINNITFKQNQLPTYAGYDYTERTIQLKYGVTFPIIGFVGIDEPVSIPLELELMIAAGGGIVGVAEDLLKDVQIPTEIWIPFVGTVYPKDMVVDWLSSLLADNNFAAGSMAHLKDKENWFFDFKYVEGSLINASNLNSFGMDHVNVEGAGRLYHSFDVDEALRIAIFDLALEMIDLNNIGSMVNLSGLLTGDLLRNPEELINWSNLASIINSDADINELLSSGADLVGLLLGAYSWENAITGVNVNNVGTANLSNVNVERFSRNGLSFTNVPSVFLSDIVVGNTGGHLGSAGVAFYGDVRKASFGGGTIKNAPIGINVGAFDMHGWRLADLGNLFGCPNLPVNLPCPADITLRNINFEENLVGVMNLGGLKKVDGSYHYSPNFFMVDARCNTFKNNLFDKLGLVRLGACKELNLPDKPKLIIRADDKSKAFDGQAFTDFTWDVSGDRSIYAYNLDTTGKTFGDAEGAVNVGSYSIVPGGFTSLNYILEYENGMLTIESAVSPPPGPTPRPTPGPFGPGGFDFPFPPFAPRPVATEEAPAARTLALAPEGPQVGLGYYLVIPPDEPESDLVPLVDVPFVEEGTQEDLDEVIAAYEALLEFFEANHEEMTDEEYAKHLLDLSAAWAAIQLRLAVLAEEADEDYNLEDAHEAAALALEHFEAHGEHLNEEQEAAFTAVMEAVEQMLGTLAGEEEEAA